MSNLSFGDFVKQFPDDDACLHTVFELKYGNPLQCPKCKTESMFYRVKSRKSYSCANCRHHLYPVAGTIMEGSTTPLRVWFYAIYMFSVSKNGVSANELQRALNVSYNTAWRIGHKIRIAMGRDSHKLSGHIEVDETLIGGKVSGGKRG